jgi:succinate-semialdehyde dehydrogenase/glutarate-semialdehyde dehydrogenase
MASTPKTCHGINPATKEANPPVPVATSSDLDRAVTAAETAFERWSQVPIQERRTALFAYADALDAEKEGFTNLLTREQGKPLAQAAFEVESAVTWIKGLACLELPETILEETAERKIVQRFTPLGVAAAIVPWNFPVLLAIGKLTSALITGNCIIIKPSPFTPYCALKLAELAIPFFPQGVVQALSGDDNLGPLLTQHPGIRKISFTGSTETGKLVAASCAKTLKHCTLELGGNDPAIVCDDVDIDQVVQKVSHYI